MTSLDEITIKSIVQREVRDQLKELRTNSYLIQEVQGRQGVMLRSVQIDVNSLKGSYRKQASEMHRVGVLLEDLDYRLAAAREPD